MKSPGKIQSDATTTRILSAGFQAVAEYDEFGRCIDARGEANRNTWIRAAEIASSRSGSLSVRLRKQLRMSSLADSTLRLAPTSGRCRHPSQFLPAWSSWRLSSWVVAGPSRGKRGSASSRLLIALESGAYATIE